MAMYCIVTCHKKIDNQITDIFLSKPKCLESFHKGITEEAMPKELMNISVSPLGQIKNGTANIYNKGEK